MTKDFYLEKRGEIIYVRFRDPKTGEILPARSSRLKNATAAEKWARAELPKLSKPDMLFSEWAAPFFGEKCPHVLRVRMEGRPYSERTRTDNKYLLEHEILTDPIASMKLCDIRRSEILAFRDRLVARRGLRRVCQRIMAALKIITREALFRDYMEKDPFLGVGLISYEKKVRLPVSRDNLKKLLSTGSWENPVHWRATMCAALTGMRAGEIRGLQWGDLGGGMIKIQRAIPTDGGEATKPKWGKVRVCPYPVALSDILEPLRKEPGDWVFSIDGGSLGYTCWAIAFRKAAKGMAGVSLHSLRHTLNTLLREAGVSDELLRGSFGWSGPEMHENYTHRLGYDYASQGAKVDDLLRGIL